MVPSLRSQVLWPDNGGYSQVVQVAVPDPQHYPHLDRVLASEVENFVQEWVVRLPDGSRIGAKRLLSLYRRINRLGGKLVRLDYRAPMGTSA